MNGVSEALLADLLAQATTQTQLLQRLVRSYSGGAGGGGGGASSIPSVGPLSILGGAVSMVVSGFKLLGSVLGPAYNIFGRLLNIVTDTGKQFADFGKRAQEVGVKMSDYFNLFSSVPLVGGLFSLKAALFAVQEGMLDYFRNISSSGATFGGSLDRARAAAQAAGLSFQEMTTFIKSSANNLALFGGSVEQGITAVSRMNKTFLSSSDSFGRSLLGLGVKFEEGAQFLAGYMGRMALMGDQRNKSDGEVIKGAKEYFYQFDLLARITGKQREQLEKDLQIKEDEMDFMAYLETVPKNMADNLLAMRNVVKEVNPAGLRQFYAAARGLSIPVDEYGQMLIRTGNAAELQADKTLNIARNSANAQDAVLEMFTLLASQGGKLNDFFKTRGVADAFFLSGEKMIGGRLMQLSKQLGDGATAQDLLNAIMKEQSGTAGKSAEAMARQEWSARNLGNALMGLAGKLLGPFDRALGRIQGWIEEGASTWLPALADALGAVLDWITGVIERYANAFKEGGIQAVLREFFTDVWKGLTTLWNSIKEPVMKFYDGTLKPMILNLGIMIETKFNEIIETLIDKLTFGIKGASAEELQANRMRAEANMAANTATGLRSQLAEVLKIPEAERTKEDKDKINSLREEIRAKEKIIRDTQVAIQSTGYNLLANSAVGQYISQQNVAKSWMPTRHGGTIGMTGNWWEKQSGPVNIQAGETVLTQSQLAQIVDTAGSNKLAAQVERLNSISAEMLGYLRETAQNTRDGVRATKGLNGNVFA